MSSDDEVKMVIKGGTVRISDLARPAAIDGLEAHGVIFEGPAILALSGKLNTFTRCTWAGSPSSIAWEVPDDRPTIVGAIALTNSTFTDCIFDGVGIAGNPRDIQALYESLFWDAEEDESTQVWSSGHPDRKP